MQGLFYLQLYFSYYFHIVVTIAQYTCDHVLERGFKAVNISIANISFEIQLCQDQGICGKLKNLFSNMCL